MGAGASGRPEASLRWRTRFAARILRAGGIVAYPTEAVYGLGCDPLDGAAVARLLDIKRRSPSKGLILVAADPEQLEPYVRPGREERRRALATWPGPVTWLMTARPQVPTWLSGGRPTLAVRVTAHPVARDMCVAFGGALVSTSANRSGQSPARDALQVRRQLREEVDWIVVGEVGGAARPSAIVDAASGETVRAA